MGYSPAERTARRCGVHTYWRGRLVESYARLGAMANPETGPKVGGDGLIAVVLDADLLTPAHTKQEFENDANGLNGMLRKWVGEQVSRKWYRAAQVETWAQCDSCKKWRLLPPGSKQPGAEDRWTCRDHPSGRISCRDAQMPWDGKAIISHQRCSHQKQQQEQQQQGKQHQSPSSAALPRQEPLPTAPVDTRPPTEQSPPDQQRWVSVADWALVLACVFTIDL